MAEIKIFILDDDIACRRMLGKIIESERLGEIVGEKEDGYNAEIAIVQSQADIVLIDLLMPGQSGIEVVENLRKREYGGRFVMISQIESKDMVAQAYAAGIEFFIHKPINRIEVVSVLKKVIEQFRLQQSLDKVRESLRVLDGLQAPVQPSLEQEKFRIRSKALEIFGDLGIIGEAGCKDLLQVVMTLNDLPGRDRTLGEVKYLKELYSEVLKLNPGHETEDVQAMEQRIRRAIKQALENMAALGAEDYHDPKFEHYAGKFFDFVEVRRKMRELEDDVPGAVSSRINIRKFIEALVSEIGFNYN